MAMNEFRREVAIMKISKRHTLWALLALAVWVAAGTSQQTPGPDPGMQQGTPLQIEGEITSLSMEAARGPLSMTVR